MNCALAKQLCALVQPDDIIWVHDYHLLPFAHCLRELGVKNRSASSCTFPSRRPSAADRAAA
ncbi:hypothetical protein BMMON2_34470 [Burkholderia mallei]